MKYLILTALLGGSILADGCAVVDVASDPLGFVTELIVGKPKKQTAKPKPPPTAKQRVHSMLGLGATIGVVLLLVGLLAPLVAKVAYKKTLPIAGAGLALACLSIWLDAYLEIILIVAAIIAGAVALYLLWRNWKKVKAMADFGDAAVKAGGLDEKAIHAAADNAIGPADSPLRNDIKATVSAAREAG